MSEMIKHLSTEHKTIVIFLNGHQRETVLLVNDFERSQTVVL